MSELRNITLGCSEIKKKGPLTYIEVKYKDSADGEEKIQKVISDIKNLEWYISEIKKQEQR